MRKEGYRAWGEITSWAIKEDVDNKIYDFRLEKTGYILLVRGQFSDFIIVPNDILLGIEEEETGRKFYHQLSKTTFEFVREKE